MPVTVIAGRAGSGKSAALYDKINTLIKSGADAVLIVPEQFTLQAERELIASSGKNGLFTVNVMSFSRLAKDIFSSVMRPRQKFIDERGKAAALSLAAANIKKELNVFGRAASFPGFASEAALLISDFKKHGISAQAIIDAANYDSGVSAGKVSDIGRIYSEYETMLKERDYIDSDDTMSHLADILPQAAHYKNTHFFIDGFDLLNAQELRTVKAMLSLSGHVTVCINYCDSCDEGIFYSGERTLSDLRDLAKETGHSFTLLQASNPHVRKHPSIMHLEKYLFAPYPEKYKGECAVTLSQAPSMQEEAEHVACEILNLTKSDKSLTLSDISILCCSGLNSYAPLYERMFARYNIACFTHRRKAISEHPAVSYIISAITAKVYNTPKSECMAMLKSGYSGVSYEDAMDFEDYVTDNAIDGYLFTRKLIRGAKKYDLDKMNEIREKLIFPLSYIKNIRKSAKEHLKDIYRMMDAASIKRTLESERETLIENSHHAYAALTSQVYNSIIAILEQLNVLFEDSETNLEQILFALEESFLSTQIGILPVSSDEVLIGELGRTKLAETKHLFIVGANESSLPPSNKQNPILTQRDIDTLYDMGIDFMNTVRAKNSVSDYAIYQAFSLPARGLHISFSDYGDDGARLPSPMIKHIAEIFNIPVEKAQIDPLLSKAAALSYTAKAFGALGDGRKPPEGWKQAVSALIAKGESERELSKMKMFLSAPFAVPEIAPKKNGDIVSSVSQIEQYASCPFSYMVQYSLRPADDPGEDITPAGEGAFLHEAMERLGERLSEYDIANLEETQVESIMQNEAQIIAENFDFQRLSRDNKGKYQASQLIKTAKHGAIVYSKHLRNSSFIPQGQEIEFGEGKPLGPIEIKLKTGTNVKITGKVDRLDTCMLPEGETVRIVDYKSSVKKVDYPQIESGRQLQLFIYMDAYLTRNPNVKASGVFYFPLRKDYIDSDKNQKRDDKMHGLFVDTPQNVAALDKDITELGVSELLCAKVKKDGDFDKNSDNISPEGFKRVLNYAKGKAEETLSAMDAGEIPVRPISYKNTSQCKYCDFSSICKKDINMHEERAELDTDSAKEIILGGEDG